MEYLYNKTWCTADGNGLLLPAGSTCGWYDLDFPHSCRITRFIVKQAAGTTPVDFTATLYSKNIEELVCHSPSPLPSPETGCEAEIYKVCSIDSTSPGFAELRSPMEGYHFKNMEGTISVPVRKIYLLLVLDQASVEDIYWDVELGCVIYD